MSLGDGLYLPLFTPGSVFSDPPRLPSGLISLFENCYRTTRKGKRLLSYAMQHHCYGLLSFSSKSSPRNQDSTRSTSYLNPNPTSCLCFPNQLLGSSLLRPTETLLLCSRLVRSYQADVMSAFSLFSAARFFSSPCPTAGVDFGLACSSSSCFFSAAMVASCVSICCEKLVLIVIRKLEDSIPFAHRGHSVGLFLSCLRPRL